ncbi:MAG: siderophore-interacting protein [Myxococcota bacterium]
MSTIHQFLTPEVLERMGHTGVVTAVTDLSPRLRQIRFSLDRSCVDWVPGVKVKLQTSETTLRSYTPSRIDPGGQWMEMIFFRHGKGPGSDWADRARPGVSALVLGPKRSMPLVSMAPWHLMLGDETTVGLFLRFVEALPQNAAVFGAIEMEAHDGPAISRLNLPFSVAQRVPEHRGTSLETWLSNTPLPNSPGVIYLSGHLDTANRLQEQLYERGISPDQIAYKPYWKEKPRR